MKETKHQRKLRKGMNAVTKQNFEDGYSPPLYKNVAAIGQLERMVKVQKGVPYVNSNNFN